MELSKNVIRLINLLVAILVTVSGVMAFINGFTQIFTAVIIGIYITVFGLLLLFVECLGVPYQDVGFLMRFAGRGLFLIFVGCLILGNDTFAIISGIITIVWGCVYLSFHFTGMDTPAPIKGGGTSSIPATGGSAV